MSNMYGCGLLPMGTRSQRSVAFDTGDGTLRGELRIPTDATDIIVAVSGNCGVSNASTESALADRLFEQGIGSLLVDLLTPVEAVDRSNCKDTDLLCDRLDSITAWLDQQDSTADLDLGFYGTETGGAAVLQFVNRTSRSVSALALRNGRIDLAEDVPGELHIPVFCSVDEYRDFPATVNQELYEVLYKDQAHTRLLLADRETDVVGRTVEWFDRYLSRAETSPKEA